MRVESLWSWIDPTSIGSGIVEDILVALSLKIWRKRGKRTLPKNEELNFFFANPTRARGGFGMSSRRIVNGETEFSYSSQADIAFSLLSNSQPVDVYALFSIDDTSMQGNAERQDIGITKLIKRPNKDRNGHYVYAFDEEFQYYSMDERVTKPFIIVVVTDKGVGLGTLVIDSDCIGKTTMEEDGILRFQILGETYIRGIFPNHVVGYKSDQYEKMQADFPNEQQIKDYYLVSHQITEALINNQEV